MKQLKSTFVFWCVLASCAWLTACPDEQAGGPSKEPTTPAQPTAAAEAQVPAKAEEPKEEKKEEAKEEKEGGW